MLSEIGSNHYYDINNLKNDININPFSYGYKGNDYKWFSSGRIASSYVLKTIEERNPNINKIALLPPYTCHTVFNPFYDAGYIVESYEIDENFVTTKEMLLKRVDEINPSVVLLQRYFGFETLPEGEEIVSELRKRNILVIEDCTQSLFSKHKLLEVDYYVASVRKYFGTPDGGFAICRDGEFTNNDIEEVNEDRLEAINQASLLKKDYIENRIGEKQEFIKLFGYAENNLEEDKTIRTISDISLKIQNSIDKDYIVRQRINNYKVLLEELSDVKDIRIIFNQVEDNDAPLYMPIYVKGDRREFQQYLVKASIYAPIVWPKAERIPCELGNVAEDFYKHVICIPMDQRYDECDMKRIAQRIKMYFNYPGLEPDIFYLQRYGKLFYVVDGEESEVYKFEHKDGTILYPLVLRKTPDGNYYDTITPRGFCGPMVIDQKSDDLTELIKAFDIDFKKYCEDKKIIAEYVRFCPWVHNEDLFKDFYKMRYNNQTVAIDLTVDDILMDQINSKRRNQIRLAIKKGVKVEFDFNGDTVETFYNLYQNTIKKNDIGKDYDFSLQFLKDHFKYLKGNCWIANAKINDKIISSSFVLMFGENMHYHLSANDYTMNAYNGNSLLLYEIAKLGKAYGCKYLHLGGVGVGNKSLMDFKTSFTKEDGIFDFYVGSRILNQEVYDKLVEEYGTGSNYFPAYRG